MRNFLLLISTIILLDSYGQSENKDSLRLSIKKMDSLWAMGINPFIIVTNGLENTKINFSNKNDVLLQQFEDSLKKDEKRVRKNYVKAGDVHRASKEMRDYIEKLKIELMRATDQVDTLSDLKYLNAMDNYDIPTRIMIGDDIKHPKGKAIELKAKINDYRKFLLSSINKRERKKLKLGLTTEDVYSYAEEKKISWEENAFYHSPIAAVVTILSKLQNDILNGECDVLNSLLNSMK